MKVSDSDREPDALGAVTISAREIYDEIIGVREDVRGLRQSRDAVTEAQEDHEERIRALESWRYALPVTALGTVAALIISAAPRLN